MDETTKQEFDKVSQHLFNVDPEMYSNLSFELYEKFHKIDSGDLRIEDFSEDELEILFEIIKEVYQDWFFYL